jgi:cation diffusion facilitator family transporter
MAGLITTRRVVATSLLVDLFDIVSNLVVALLTDSAVIFAEMAQGLADATGSLLLVVGYWRAKQPRSAKYPLGHDREVFFWVLLAALVMLVLGAGLSSWRGYRQLVDPQPLENLPLALGILIVSVCTNGYALSLSARKLREGGLGLREAFRGSKRPMVNTSLLQDSLGTGSALMGLIALLIYVIGGVTILDGLGAILIAALMVVFALALVHQAQRLIAGRGVPGRVQKRILAVVQAVPGVDVVNALVAVFIGAQRIEVHLDIDARDDLDTDEIEALLDRIEAAARSASPDVAEVRIDLNSPRAPDAAQ